MSTRLVILPKQRQPDSIAGPLRDWPGSLINPFPVIVDLGSLRKAMDRQHRIFQLRTSHRKTA